MTARYMLQPNDDQPLFTLSLHRDEVRIVCKRTFVEQWWVELIRSGKYAESLQGLEKYCTEKQGQYEGDLLIALAEAIGAGDGLAVKPKKDWAELRALLEEEHGPTFLSIDERAVSLLSAYEVTYSRVQRLENGAAFAPKPWNLASHPERASRLGRDDARAGRGRKQADEVLAAVGLDVGDLPAETLARARAEVSARYHGAYDAWASDKERIDSPPEVPAKPPAETAPAVNIFGDLVPDPAT